MLHRLLLVCGDTLNGLYMNLEKEKETDEDRGGTYQINDKIVYSFSCSKSFYI